MKRALLLAASAAFLVVVGCNPYSSTPAASASGGTQVVVKGLDTLRFDPSSISAKAGQPIEVTFENTGQIAHDFTLTEGVDKPVLILEQAGRTGGASFAIQKPGTYRYICSQPGHAAAGMVGTLTIQ
jgi:uncharacterized cupredoxin-like copper-binding protein